MKELSLNEIKQIEFRLLKEIHTICMQEKLRYSLCGGTLLGAVRHGGFIPWDDDVDIFMPRPDYEKLIQYCQTHEVPFRLVCSKTDKHYGYLFAKVADRETFITDTNCNLSGIDMGVYVDIFPIDGLGDTWQEAQRRFKARALSRELLVAANWKHFFRSKSRAWYYEPIRFAFFLMSRLVRPEKMIARIERYYAKKDFETAAYVACVCGVYRAKEIGLREEYTQYIDIPFEDGSFKAIKTYHSYLSRIYGDYMQMPPTEQRTAHHTFEAYYREPDHEAKGY